jgi:hypothetical protein
VNASQQVVRWNVYGNYVQGNTWNAPDWDSILPTRETNVERQIDQVSQLLLFKELGTADRISIKNAIAKAYGPDPDMKNRYRDITSLIFRLIFQLPVWSLR